MDTSPVPAVTVPVMVALVWRLTMLSASEPATLTVPPPAPEVAVALNSLCASPADVTSAFTVAGPFAVPATVAELVTFASLMATAAPIVAGGPRAAVAEPSAFAFASVAADDQSVSPPELIVRPDGRLALDVVFATFTATAAAAVTEPFDELAGGVEPDPEPVAPFPLAVPFPSVRWLATCMSGVAAPELASEAPFALAVALVSVDELPLALNSTVWPSASKLLAVVARTR